jgi:hypothetical protein
MRWMYLFLRLFSGWGCLLFLAALATSAFLLLFAWVALTSL